MRIIWSIIIPFLLIALWFLGYPLVSNILPLRPESIWVSLFWGLVAYMIAFALWWVYHMVIGACLIVTPYALIYQGFGAKGTTTWENLDRLGFHLLKNRRGHDWGILLHKPAEFETFFSYYLFGGNSILSDQHIPLHRFVYVPWGNERKLKKFMETPFGQALLEYAPHVFDIDLPEKPKLSLK